MCAQSRVLISTVGPFYECGEVIVKACIAGNCHYLDSTGETHFIAKIIQECHNEAVQKNVIVIPSCAFEAALPDYGALLYS